MVVVEGTGHLLDLSSYEARKSRFASADRKGWCGESKPFELGDRATAKMTRTMATSAVMTPQPTIEYRRNGLFVLPW
jgi:hypothetical protein